MSVQAPPAPPAVHVPHMEEKHPGPGQYIVVAFILTVVTAVEVAAYYVDLLGGFLPWFLIVLSAAKFALVVMYYMHLKFDHPLFTGMFLFGLSTAGFTIVLLLALFGYFLMQGA